MGGSIGPLARLQRLRHRDDPSVQEDLRWSRHDVDLPAGLEIEWLGTAGFRLAYEGTTVLIDPFVTRRSLAASLRARSLQSDPAAVDRHLPTVDAVLVGHTHFDHAVDVPEVARTSRCRVLGSRSLVHLLGLHGLSDLATEVEPHEPYEIGPFTVRFRPSEHSKLLLGLAVNSDGELTCDSLDHLSGNRYRCGQVWGISVEVAGITIYHQGSANLIEGEIRDRQVDVFLCGIAGRSVTPDFVGRVIRALDPRLLLAHHHDDMFRSVDARMGFSFNVNLGGFAEDVDAIAPDVPVRTLDPFETVQGG